MAPLGNWDKGRVELAFLALPACCDGGELSPDPLISADSRVWDASAARQRRADERLPAWRVCQIRRNLQASFFSRSKFMSRETRPEAGTWKQAAANKNLILLLIYRTAQKRSFLISPPLLCSLPETASDCHEWFLRGASTSGVYTIQPASVEPFKVFCEMTAGESSGSELHLLRSAAPARVLIASCRSFVSSWRVDGDSETPGRLRGL